MSLGAFEQLGQDVAEIRETCRRLEASLEGGSRADARWASIASIAKRYDCAKSTVRELLCQMAAEGFAVGTSKIGRDWRVDVAQFDRAYDSLFRKSFI